jgi:DNA repair exonuclease SbcCD ATPase subunit
MIKKFLNLPYADQNRLLIIISLLLLTGYFGLRYPTLNKAANFQHNMVSRQKDRIEKRIVTVESSGIPIAKLSQQLDELEKNIAEKQQKLKEYGNRFASLEDASQIRQLKLEISRLAERFGLSIVRIGGNAPATTPNPLKQEVQHSLPEQTNNRYGRPLITFEAISDYAGLQQFLDGIRTLSNNVTVVQLEVKAKISEDKGSPEARRISTPLNIKLLMAM